MNYALWNLFGPASWLVWLALIGAFAVFTDRWRLARLTTFLGAAVAVGIYVLPTGSWLMQKLESPYARGAPPPEGIKDIVVLTGAERLYASAASGRLETNQHGERVSEAVALATALPRARLWIVGGVDKHTARRDVDWTVDYWRRAGIAAKRIGIIDRTFDTCGNAAGVARELPGRRVLLVTSAFHLPRAMACMRAAGVDADPYPVDFQDWNAGKLTDAFSIDLLGNADRVDLALHEYVGIAYYRLTGRID